MALTDGNEIHPQHWSGTTLTAGEIIDFLSQLPRETPVTADDEDNGWWLNVTGLQVQGLENEFPIVNFYTTNNFDTRQWF